MNTDLWKIKRKHIETIVLCFNLLIIHNRIAEMTFAFLRLSFFPYTFLQNVQIDIVLTWCYHHTAAMYTSHRMHYVYVYNIFKKNNAINLITVKIN